MALLQGNTYLKPVQVLDSNGNVIKANRVVKGEFVFGDLYKYYGDGGEVVWNEEANAFIVPLTEEDTFSLEGAVECQARLVLDDGSVSGSVPEGHYVYESKSKTRLTEGGAGAESGELLTLKLLKEFTYVGGGSGSGGIVEETDPTVPSYVKNIKESDIGRWNNKAEKSEIPDVSEFATKSELPTKVSQLDNDEGFAKETYVNTKVADLVNSAPETLDTLGEVAKAIEENADVVSALNSAIGNKVDKTELADYVKNTDYANYGVTGVVSLRMSGGLAADNGALQIYKANNNEIAEKAHSFKPLVPASVDQTVKVGITTNTIELTEEEKASAKSWLGVPQFTATQLEDGSYSLSINTEV